jgi:hypothetical protein
MESILLEQLRAVNQQIQELEENTTLSGTMEIGSYFINIYEITSLRMEAERIEFKLKSYGVRVEKEVIIL